MMKYFTLVILFYVSHAANINAQIINPEAKRKTRQPEMKWKMMRMPGLLTEKMP